MLTSKLVIMLENQYIKRFFQKSMFEIPIRSEKAFVIEKVKNTVPFRYVISDLNEEEIIGKFYKKNQKEFRVEKINKKKR